MTKEKLIKNLIIGAVVMIIIFTFMISLSYALSTIIGNYIALDQMQNDDFVFIVKEMYNNFLKPFCSFVGAITVVAIIGLSSYDVIKFIKKKKED